jgi:citrate lyase subunit beta/citryl-CoA lyase
MDAVYREAQEKGLGAVVFEGKMIDVAVARNARNILEKGEMMGM